MLSSGSCKSEVVSDENACVCLVSMVLEQGEGREVPLLVLTDSLSRDVDSSVYSVTSRAGLESVSDAELWCRL